MALPIGDGIIMPGSPEDLLYMAMDKIFFDATLGEVQNYFSTGIYIPEWSKFSRHTLQYDSHMANSSISVGK